VKGHAADKTEPATLCSKLVVDTVVAATLVVDVAVAEMLVVDVVVAVGLRLSS